MYIASIILLVVTAFFIGRITSNYKIRANDPEWLLDNLKRVGVNVTVQNSADTNSAKTEEKSDTTSGSVEGIIKDQKAKIKKVFTDSIKTNLSRGVYKFYSHSEVYNIFSPENTKEILAGILKEFEKNNPSISVDASFCQKNGGYYVSFTIKVR